MREDLVEVVIIMDKSGSMNTVVDDTIGGFNSFIKKQKKLPGKASFTKVQFDTNVVIDGPKDIQEVEPLTKHTYSPGGSTALLDAIGQTIDSVGLRLRNTKEEDRPNKVVVVIITDGQENSSVRFTKAKIKDMIEHQTNRYAWEFHFMGANQDSFAEAGSLGVSISNTQNWDYAHAGSTYSHNLNSVVTNTRMNNTTTK